MSAVDAENFLDALRVRYQTAMAEARRLREEAKAHDLCAVNLGHVIDEFRRAFPEIK